jgi:hypothetical protein
LGWFGLVWVLDLGVRDLVELALIWWDESQSLLEFRKHNQDKLEYIAHKARHGDANARLYIEIIDWALETRFTLEKIYLDRTRDLPIYDWAKVRPEFPLEKTSHPLEELQGKLETLAANVLDTAYMRCYARGDRDGFISLFLRLPYKLRKWYLDRPYAKKMIEEFVGPEILEIMDKARIEVKVVVGVEDVIPLIKTYGSGWRERLKEIVRKAINIEVE